MTFRFADPSALNFLYLIPVLIFLYWYVGKARRKRFAQVFDARQLQFVSQSQSRGRSRAKLAVQLLAAVFFVLALARPQSGEGKQKAKSEGLEIMFVVDVSNSMMAEDVRPSRLELAKRELGRFVDDLGGDRVGLVAFAGSAVLLSPLTSDKNGLKMFLESLSVESVSTQGTDFKKALTEASQALYRGGAEANEDSSITRVIVVVSDGEENEKGGLETAKEISTRGAKIYTLGIGTAQGGKIPLRDKRGNLVGYKKNRSGEVVISKSTGEALKELAEAGGGQYQHVTLGGDAVRNLKNQLSNLERKQFESMDVAHYNELYQWFLAVGLFFAFLDLLLGERRREGRLWRGRFEVAGD